MNTHPTIQRATRCLATMGSLLLVVACSGAAGQPSSVPTAARAPTPAASPALGHTFAVFGSGSYPGYTVSVPDGWHDLNDSFVVKYPTDKPAPVLGLSVWDVGRVYRDPCHWQGQAYNPGPTVGDLVKALTAQPMRSATKPSAVTLAGYSGEYLEWSVPADMKSSTWTDFDNCDVEPSDGHRNFESWLGNGGVGNRYQQVPGQVDRLWILDVGGKRLVIDATYSPDTTKDDRAEQEQVVESLRFVNP